MSHIHGLASAHAVSRWTEPAALANELVLPVKHPHIFLYELMLKQEISEVGQAKHDLKPGVFLFNNRTLHAPLRSVGRDRWRNMEVGPARFHALLW